MRKREDLAFRAIAIGGVGTARPVPRKAENAASGLRVFLNLRLDRTERGNSKQRADRPLRPVIASVKTLRLMRVQWEIIVATRRPRWLMGRVWVLSWKIPRER